MTSSFWIHTLTPLFPSVVHFFSLDVRKMTVGLEEVKIRLVFPKTGVISQVPFDFSS